MTKKMKKIICLILSIGCVVLSACGKTDDKNNDDRPENRQERQIPGTQTENELPLVPLE